jgi:hypothetical protein
MAWVLLAQDKESSDGIVCTLVNLRVPQKANNFLSNCRLLAF